VADDDLEPREPTVELVRRWKLVHEKPKVVPDTVSEVLDGDASRHPPRQAAENDPGKGVEKLRVLDVFLPLDVREELAELLLSFFFSDAWHGNFLV